MLGRAAVAARAVVRASRCSPGSAPAAAAPVRRWCSTPAAPSPEDEARARREAARAAMGAHAALAEQTMQEDLQETGFVLVASEEEEAVDERDKVHAQGPHGINTPGDVDDDDRADPHYEDTKLIKRLRGTPGFNEQHVREMLPLVRKDPTLIDDLQDMETAAHFQSIARDPKRAQAVLEKHPKVKDILMRVTAIKKQLEAEQDKRAVDDAILL